MSTPSIESRGRARVIGAQAATATRPLTIAFLGCGGITRKHSRTLATIAPSVRRAYASRDAGRARQYAADHSGVAYFDSYDGALADDRVDAVLIATPPSTHLELTLLALSAGKHVIVEKPPFLRAADVGEVELAVRASGRQVCVAENYAYKPLVARLRALVEDGALGEVRFVQLNALKEQGTGDWRDDHALSGGGALFEGGIHWIAFMSSIGMPIESVEAFRPGAPAGLERSVLVVARYEGGAVGTLHYSWEIPSPLRGLRLSRIFGAGGTATFESNGAFLVVSGKRSSVAFPGFRDIVGYRAMFADFIEAIASGRPPRYDLAAARRDLALVEQAYRSIGTGS